jgi:hypothetical protein
VGASQRSVEAPEQAFFAEGLVKKANGPGLQRPISRSFFWEGCDKNRRQSNTPIDQIALEVKATQTGHLHIGDQAGSTVYAIRLQEFFSRRKRRRLVAKRSYEPFSGLSHGLIIIDN